MNYLPFVRRAAVSLPVHPARRAVTIPSMAVGPNRAILQDLEIFEHGAVNYYKPNDTVPNGQTARARLMMRYGWEKKGFLTEAFHPVGAYLNIGRPFVPVWKFERPFRLNPGEALTATILAGGAYNIVTMPAESTPGLMFNAVRVKDTQPKILYDVSRSVDATGTVNSLEFRCDADSPMFLYSVTAHDWYEYNAIPTAAAAPTCSELQIFSPGGREWFHYESAPTLTAAQLNVIKGAWLEGYCDKVDLGEQSGWVMENHESFIVELMQQDESQGSTVVVFVTLRGVLEMPND